MNTDELEFLSGESRRDLFIVAAGILNISARAWRPSTAERWISFVIWSVVCCFLLWRSLRTRGSPYIRLGTDRLQVFVGGKPQRDIALASIATLEPKFNRTVLRLHDGSEISLTHLLFRQGEDAAIFRTALAERLGQINGMQITSI